MSNLDVPVGERFARWVVLDEKPTRQNQLNYWVCRCDCGTERAVRPYRLRTGESKSCGCLHREIMRKTRGNLSHGLSRRPEYKAWQQAKQRCFNPKHHMFAHYGGRGITMCEEWRDDVLAFFEHVGERPGAEYSIGRIDNDGNYEPGNVEWQTQHEQNSNKRSGRKRQVALPSKEKPRKAEGRPRQGEWIWRDKNRPL